MWLMCLLAAHQLQCQSSSVSIWEADLLSCIYIASLWLQRFLWVGRTQIVFAPSFFCVWSQRPWQSQQIILLPVDFFPCTPRIQRIVKICDAVDLFLRKPFWFFLSIFSILGSMQFHSRALYILATLDVRVIPR